MSEIVNLRRARKAKARAAAAETAAANRARFGRPRSEREAGEQVRLLESRRLDAHLREPAPKDDSDRSR
jgi:hypothetical protein